MLLIDLLAAHANEGVSWEMLRRFMPKFAGPELDLVFHKFGPSLYREVIWDERVKEAIRPSSRFPLAWPINRSSAKVIPIRSRQK